MKRFSLFLLAFAIVISLLGCTPEEMKEPANNEVFTDEYLKGVTQMSLMGVAGPISAEQMQEVIAILQGATLSALGEGVSVQLEESFLLILTYDDGVARTVILSDTIVAKNEVDAKRYLVAEGAAFINGILEAFGVPVQVG